MSKEILRCIEGTKDLFGKNMDRFQRIDRVAEEVFTRYGYARFSTPVFEDTRLFSRSIGEVTDIVEKEMYTFTPGSDTITLRPEGTAGVVRAVIQHQLLKEHGFLKLWYGGPMFRRERPQKGRQRQFHQIGVESIGSQDPLLDAEIIRMVIDFFDALGIQGIRTRLNSIGCNSEACRPAFRVALKSALAPEVEHLCKNCQNRFERNVMRILDCKNPQCQKIREVMPRCDEHLCDSCGTHHTRVQDALTSMRVPFQVDPCIVRGLDYYSKTVFEFSHPALGAQDAIGAGGRYDGLMAELGGVDTPAVGFALGVERIMIALEALEATIPVKPLDIFGICGDESCHQRMLPMLHQLRQAGFSADMDFEGKSFKAQMRKANRRGALAVLILGPDERKNENVTVKDMREGGSQCCISQANILETIERLLKVPASGPSTSCNRVET